MMYKYVTKIRELLKAGIPASKIEYYYIGNPRNISSAEAERGFVIIDPQPITTTIADNWNDSEEGEIDVIVGVQSRSNNNMIRETEGDDQEALLEAMELMEGVDSNGNLKTDTVKYILRNNITKIGINQPTMVTDYTNQRDENYIYAIKLTITTYEQRQR